MLLLILKGVVLIVIAFLVLIAINTAVAIHVMSHFADDEVEQKRMESNMKCEEDKWKDLLK